MPPRHFWAIRSNQQKNTSLKCLRSVTLGLKDNDIRISETVVKIPLQFEIRETGVSLSQIGS